MLSFLCLVGLLILIARIFLKERIVAFAAFFLLFPIVFRSIDITYLDIFGPLYAAELGRYVGGNEAAPVFILSMLTLVIPLLIVFRERASATTRLRERPAWEAYHQLALNSGFFALSAAVAALYINMIIKGPIPLLQGMDRIEYGLIAGVVHNGAYELNFLLSFALGAATVLPRLNGRDIDIRFVGVFAALLFYWVLTGNRFSIFFSGLSFFLIPVAGVLILNRLGVNTTQRSQILSKLLGSRSFRLAGMLFVIAALIGLVANSYFNVRNYREPIREIEERILLQPVELWAATWDKVDLNEFHFGVDRNAVDQIFINPIDNTRNTTVQYLITQQLGYFRSAELAKMGQQYNGGFPEVHFELFSPWLALFPMILFGIGTALMLRFVLILLCRNMIGSSIAAMYVFYGFTLHYAGGFLIFALTPTYWVKIAVMFFAIMFERQFVKPAIKPPPRVLPSQRSVRAGGPAR